MNRLSLATTVAAAAGAVAISLAGAGVASAVHTGVVIGPVHPQIDTLVGGIVTNVGTANQLVGKNGNGSNIVGPAPVHPNGGN
jgi:hypothetical protein